MAKKHADAVNAATQSTEIALTQIALHIQTLVVDQTLDSRCAAKLIKRLKKEGENVARSGGGTKGDRKTLLKTFDSFDIALLEQNATLLVAANAALREIDAERAGKHKKHRGLGAMLVS
ncbi:hypothetical protein [Paraburkholderia fungorum]|uniref:hypothetical protein n=1 Tax=Paraburkholderia fungorum TaxID=134537 RepID=UPI0038B8D059